MAYDLSHAAGLGLHRSGLRVNGTENQDLRLVIRATRLRFTAINGLGLPLLDGIFKVTQGHPIILSAMLALAENLRVGYGHTPASSSREQDDSSPEQVEKHQNSLVLLQDRLARFQSGEPEIKDVQESLACVMLLITAGFPGLRDSSSYEWALHIQGMVSLIETLGEQTVGATAIGGLARDMVAQFSIAVFSLGTTIRLRQVWLDWNIQPPETPQSSGLSELEIMLGYPKTLLTILSAMSAVFEERSNGHVEVATSDHVLRIYRSALHGKEVDESHGRVEGSKTPCSMLETALTVWTPPENLPSLTFRVTLAVTSAWEVMRKAALVHLWRGGFSANFLHPLPEEQAKITTKFIREMLVTLRALLHEADENRVTIMNIMTWPVAVIASESSRDKALQEEIMSILSGMDRTFNIPHLKYTIQLMKELWRRIEAHDDEWTRTLERNQDWAGEQHICPESICQDLHLCLPLF